MYFCENSLKTFPNIHNMDTKDTLLDQTVTKLFHCEICDVHCSIKTNLERHLNSRNHQKNDKKIQNDSKFICQCGKKFKYHSGLWRHKKKCELIIETHGNGSSNELIIKLLKQNQELQKLIIELSK